MSVNQVFQTHTQQYSPRAPQQGALLPPGEFKSMIPIPMPIYHENFMRAFLVLLQGNKYHNIATKTKQMPCLAASPSQGKLITALRHITITVLVQHFHHSSFSFNASI